MFDHIFAPKSRRPVTRRRPQLEAVEGRMLLSGIVGQHIGMSVAASAIQGSHIGTNVASDAIQGNHIGMATPSVVLRKH